MNDPRFRVVRVSGWRAVAALVVGAGVLAALALGFVFIILPALLVASIVYYFLPKRAAVPLQKDRQSAASGTIIDGTYRIEDERN